jgi:hypothetical protein
VSPFVFSSLLFPGTGYEADGSGFQRRVHLCSNIYRHFDYSPVIWQNHSGLALAYAAVGHRKNAIEECELAVALSRRATFTLLTAAAVHAMLPEEAEARSILEDVERNWKPDGVSFWIAVGHASLGGYGCSLRVAGKGPPRASQRP